MLARRNIIGQDEQRVPSPSQHMESIAAFHNEERISDEQRGGAEAL
jgi:hypothetical protein